MKRWPLIILLLLSIGLNIGLFASRVFKRPTDGRLSDDRQAAEVSQRGNDRLPQLAQRMARELGLEGTQRQTFIDIQRGFFEQTMAARRRMADLQLEVRREITSAEPNRETLDTLLIELSEAHIDLERAFVNNLLESRELLDPQQERRFMRFLGRMRHVRTDLERRFRARWRGMEGLEGRQDLRPRRRRGRLRPPTTDARATDLPKSSQPAPPGNDTPNP